jgi:photosystem II stability/assembly factor-like uncharacterized protein
MKKLLYILLISFCSMRANAQWMPTYQTPFPQIAKVMSSPNDSVCWVISNMDTLFKTSDGGQTWTSLPPSATTFNPSGLFVISKDTAYKASTSRLYKTVDGGVTWSLNFIGVASNTPVIYMKNSNVGIMISNTLLYKTTNGGFTWSFATITQPPFPLINAPDKGSLCVIGDTIWVACANHGASYSPDFGVTWNLPANNGLTFGSYGKISFSNTQIGIAIQHNSDTVYVTTDGAANWMASINTMGANQDVLSVDSELWFIPSPADNFYIKYSADSGTTWTQQLFDQSGFEQLEKSRIGRTLWAGTDKGKIYTYNNQLVNTIGKNISPESSVSVSPNPFSTYTNISTRSISAGTVVITTIFGEVLQTVKYSGNSCNIDRGNLPNGIYIARIIDGKGNIDVKKIIVQ